jgi:hypothetical protein
MAGCAAGPLGSPTSAGPMNKPVALSSEPGSGAIEATRRELSGTWDLVALESGPGGGRPRVPVRASGTLLYDELGNLTIEAHTTDAAAPVAAREVSMLAFKGRAVLDVVTHELKLMDVTGNVNPDEVLSPERRRHYELTAGTLKLTSFDADGQITAISTWQRRK